MSLWMYQINCVHVKTKHKIDKVIHKIKIV